MTQLMAHLADIHFSKENQELALTSLKSALEIGMQRNIDAWIFAGDLFEHGVQNSESSGLPRLVTIIQQMLDVAPIVSVEGTKTHDLPGCYDILCEIQAKNRFYNLKPDKSQIISDILFLGLPEVSKDWFLRDKRLGQDETIKAIKEGMRNILLGMAAQRKEHSDSPCVLVYHGMVSGSTLQNGQILKPGDIAIGRDDLALVGFDYGALGHIHLEQQIPGLNAYYPGPAYHTDWGHLGRCGFNLVTLNDPGQDPLVDRIPFPHPPRKKIVIRADEAFLNIDLRDYQVRLIIHDKRGAITEEKIQYLKGVLQKHALPGSEVKVEIIPTETVRAGEIQNVKTLREKVQVYANNSGQQIPGKVLDKADELESEARREGGGADGLHIRIDKLSLRGAIGIWKGLGKDEIEVDLAEYDPGLVTLVGPNGAGKTTLIENMHPFPDLLTRAGKLQDHFRLRDSHRDLYFTDERTGEKYRAFIQVDGQNKTGKAEYHLYKNGQPLTNGRKDDYESEVFKLFGSLSLFQRSAFIAQKPSKNNPDLSEATKGEKKSLFRELGGLDYLQAYSETAKENGKSLEEQITESRGRTATLQELIAKLPELESLKKHDEGNLKMGREALIGLERSNRDLKSALEQVKLRVDKNRETQGKITDITAQMHGLRRDAHGLEGEIEDYQVALEEKEETEKALQTYQSLKDEEARLNEEKAKILGEREKLLSAYRDAKDTADNERREIEAKKAKVTQEMAVYEQKKAVFLTQIDNLQKRLEEKVECPNCGYQWSIGQVEDEIKLEENQSQVWEIDKELAALEKQIVVFDKTIADIFVPIKPILTEWDNARIDEVQFGLSGYNLAKLQRILAQANEAGVRIEENQKQIVKINEQQELLTKQLAELNKKIDEKCEDQYAYAARDLGVAEKQYIDAREEVRGMEVALEKLTEAIGDLKAKKKELADLQQAIKDKEAEITEWRYLERACGPDGIQALELDAMGPSVASVANDMLEAAYGSRFKVEFRTTRIGGSGNKTKQIEDFQIWILDSQTGDEQTLETLSGGESVWIRNAIYSAFGIIRDRNTGQRFLTAYLDEADGALDPDARLKYFRLLERSHQISGRRHTIVISHSEAAREMIAQKIEMSELGAAEKAEVI